jgi:hypothetical protein
MVTGRVFVPLLACVALGAAACKPKLEGRASLVDGERVLAVRSSPAEAKPGAAVRYDALYVGPDGPADAASLDWGACGERKPLAVIGPIASACLAETSEALTPLALDDTARAEAKLSADICRVFGPTPPDQKKGEPPSRPSDPDPSGGYYQPVRVRAQVEGRAEYSVGVTRLDCGLGGATQEQASTYAMQHRPNENPKLEALARRGGGPDEVLSPEDMGAQPAPLLVAPGAVLSLRASWAACPTTPRCGDGICSPGESAMCGDCVAPADGAVPGCTGSEPYLQLDPVKHALVQRREAIRISWFATDGAFEHDRTGRAEVEAKTSFSDNHWTAPTTKGEVRLWVVIRDDRGGVGWGAYRVDVRR